MAHTAQFERSNGGFLHSWLATLLPRRRRRGAVLDVRELPDHLKRDMGFLDGKDPAGRYR
jgi:hypothetical protein